MNHTRFSEREIEALAGDLCRQTTGRTQEQCAWNADMVDSFNVGMSVGIVK